ncbi:MAG: acyl-ACP--UDP-N-acetylglucosamine O-acyltransferase [Fibrobacterota bacterium]
MSLVHPSAIIDPKAELDPTVEVGPFCLVGPKVKIDAGTRLLSHVRVDGPTRIGKNNTFFPFSYIGAVPQDLKYKGEESELIVGDNNRIRECVTLNRGTTGGGNVTKVGNNCLLMAYVHLGHDTIIEDDAILANAANLAGHVTVQRGARVGGMTAVTQFVVIGAWSYLGAQAMVHKDIPPFVSAHGNPIEPRGINKVGLERHGLSEHAIKELQKAYKIFFMRNLTVKESEAALRAECDMTVPELSQLLEFILNSKNGIAR